MNQGPGQSLFQGDDQLNVDNNDSLAEQEAAEEQIRRNNELEHLLTNAFDDLIDDDNHSSINITIPNIENVLDKGSKAIVAQDSDHVISNREGPLEHRYRGTELGTIEQLQILYEARVRENTRLKNENTDLNERINVQTDKFTKCQQNSEKEKLQLTISLNEAHKQIASLKIERETLLTSNNELNDKLHNEESEKEEIAVKLSSAHQSLLDLEERMKNNISCRNESDRIAQEQICELRESYKNDTTRLENIIQSKDDKISQLTEQLKKCEKENQTLVIDKAERMERLLKNMEELQKTQEINSEIRQKLDLCTCKSTSNILERTPQELEPRQSVSGPVNYHTSLIHSLQEELRRTLSAKSQMQNRVNQLEKLITDLKSINKRLSGQLEHYEIELGNKSKKLTQFQAEVIELSAELNKNKKELQQLQDKYNKIHSEFVKISKKSDNNILKLKNQLDEKNDTLAQLQNNVTIRDQAILKLQDHVNDLMTFSQESHEENLDLQIKLNERNDRNSLTTDSRIIELNAEKDKLEKQIGEQNEKIITLETEMKNEYHVKDEEICKQKRCIDDLLNSNREYEIKIKELLFKIDKKRKEITEAQNIQLEINAKIKQLEKQIQNRDEKVDNLESQIVRQHMKFEEMKSKFVEIYSTTVADYNNEKICKETVQQENMALSEKINNLSSEVEMLSKSLQIKDGIINNFECVITQLAASNTALNEKMENNSKVEVKDQSTSVEPEFLTTCIDESVFVKYTKEIEKLSTQNASCLQALNESKSQEKLYLNQLTILKKTLEKFCKEICALNVDNIKCHAYLKICKKHLEKPTQLHKNTQTERSDEIAELSPGPSRINADALINISEHLNTISNILNQNSAS